MDDSTPRQRDTRLFEYAPDQPVEQRLVQLPDDPEGVQRILLGGRAGRATHIVVRPLGGSDIFLVLGEEPIEHAYHFRVGESGQLTVAAGGSVFITYGPSGWEEYSPF